MYKPVPINMKDYIRKTGYMRHTLYRGWSDQDKFADTPYKLEFIRRFPKEKEQEEEFNTISRIGECYITIDFPFTMFAKHLKEHEKLKLDLPYRIFFIRLAIENLLALAKSMEVKQLMIETRVSYITEIFLDLGFKIKVLEEDNKVYKEKYRVKYQGTKNIE